MNVSMIDLPKQSEDDKFIYNLQEQKGDIIRLTTYDKEKQKHCFPLYYKRSKEGFLTQANEKEYERD